MTDGIIISDDYGLLAHRVQKAVEDTWLAERGFIVLELLTGQGLLIKWRLKNPAGRCDGATARLCPSGQS